MVVKFSPKQAKAIRMPYNVSLDVFEGTPRSSKTTSGVFRCAKFLATTPDENHLVVAYNQEQAFRLFIDCDGMGLMHIYRKNSRLKSDRSGDYLEIALPNGVKKVYYKGGGKVSDQRKIRGMSIGSVWFMEIDLIHMEMIQECFRRTMASRLRYHFADLNPPSPNHPVIKEVFDIQDTRVTHWTIHDNPIITEERKKEIYETLSKNEYLLTRDWYGKRTIPKGVIYSMWNKGGINVVDKLEGEIVETFFSGDGGQSDATSVSCNVVTFIKGKGYRLNRLAHYYHSGSETGDVKSMRQYSKEIKTFIKWCCKRYDLYYNEVLLDPACLSLREELREEGIDTTKADNNSREAKRRGGGIEVGIERCQNLMSSGEFVVVKDDKDEYDHYHFEKELELYVRDKNGVPISENDHSLDEFKYSVNYYTSQYRG